MQHRTWESKEIAGFFWLRNELGDAFSEEELEQLVRYFMVVHDAWEKCFGVKLQRAPLFRFKQSALNPTHLKIQMLRVSNEAADDAVLAEKAVYMQGTSLALVV